MINWILIIGFGLIVFFLCIIVLNLAGLRRSFDLLGQLVAIAIRDSGLVRTHAEVKSDMEEAAEEELERISEAELEAEEALKGHEE